MCRGFFKRGLTAVALVGLGLFLLKGTNAGAYGKAMFGWMKSSVTEQIPIELDIRAARTMLQDMDKKIDRATYAVSREHVEVQQMEKLVADRDVELKNMQGQIVSLKAQFETGLTSMKPVEQKRAEARLAGMYGTYTQLKSTHTLAAETLDRRKEGLAADELRLANLKAKKAELKAKIEALDAKRKLMEADKVAAKKIVDDSEIADVKNLVTEIEKKLMVDEEYQRRTDGEQASQANADPTSTKDLLEKLDKEFGKAPTKPTKL